MAVSIRDLKITIIEEKHTCDFKEDMCKLIASLIHNEIFDEGDEFNEIKNS